MKKLVGFRKDLVKLVADYVGCGTQYNGCPCNTCFFTYMEGMGIPANTATKFWHFLLVLRGDYTEKQISQYEKNKLDWVC